MTINSIIKQKNISIYRLSKDSGVPYATLNDICNGKTSLKKSSAETVYRIARALKINMEDILSPLFLERGSFENFKSTVCHRLKEKGDAGFLAEVSGSGDIQTFYELGWYPEALYLLAMLDYVCRSNGFPLYDEYRDMREVRLEKTIYPASLIALAAVSDDDSILTEAEKNAIPEFRRFNIIENEVRNVI